MDHRRAQRGNWARPHAPDIDGKTALAVHELNVGAAPCAPDRLWWLPDGERLLVGCGASFAMIDRQGRELLPPQPGTPHDLTTDGRRLLLELAVGAEVHVAVFDLDDRTTVDIGPGRGPVWRPAAP